MWLLDSIKTRVKKWTDTIIEKTAKVGNYMEEKSATLIEKVPGGHEFKEKAAVYTEKTVDRIGSETKEMIKEWHEFVDSHMKKSAATTETKVETVAPVVTAPVATDSVVLAPVAEIVSPVETKESVVDSAEKVEHHTHKKVVEKMAHTTKKSHTNTK